MDHEDPDAPDSGRSTSREHFNPSEMLTSTPLPTPRRRPSSSLRRNSLVMEPFSPVSASRFQSNSNDDYHMISHMIDVVKKNKQLEEDVTEMRNLSMMSEHELEEKDAKIAELEEEMRKFTVTAVVDLRKNIKQEDVSVSCTLAEEKWREEMDKWKEEKKEMEETKREIEEEIEEERKRRQREKEEWEEERRKLEEERKKREGKREEMEEKMRGMEEELEKEKKKVEELNEWRIKCEVLETEKEMTLKRATTTVERNERLMREKEERMEEEWKRREKIIERVEEQMEEKENENVDLRGRVREMEVEMERVENEKKEIEEEMELKRREIEGIEKMKERILELESSLSSTSSDIARVRYLDRDLAEARGRITVAEEELRETTKHYEDLKKVRGEELGESLTLKTKVHELETSVSRLKREKEEWEERRKEGEKIKDQLEEMREEEKRRKGEMDELLLDLERRREKQKRLEDELDIARKLNEDATQEMTRMKEEREKERKEMEEERKKEKEEREKERKKEREEEKMVWMSKELRENEEEKKKMEKEKEDLELRVREAIDTVNEYRRHYEEIKDQFEEFKASAQLQYNTEFGEKEEELRALRERLEEMENYPGQFVSVDGRFSEGRSLYSLLPIQLKEALEACEDDSVKRAIGICESMVIRGQIDKREEEEKKDTVDGKSTVEEKKEEEERDTVVPPAIRWVILIDRLVECRARTSIGKNLLDALVRVFERMEDENGSDTVLAQSGEELEEEIVDLEDKIETMMREEEEMGRIMREREEEKRRMEEEARRADDGRKKIMGEMGDLRSRIVKMTEEKEEAKKLSKTFEDAAIEFRELFYEKIAELEELEKELHKEKVENEEHRHVLEEKKRKVDMLYGELRELEGLLEENIEKNSRVSRKVVEMTNEISRLEKEKRRGEKELELEQYKREKLKVTTRGLIDSLAAHYRVYEVVKKRSLCRQMLLDTVAQELKKARRKRGEEGNEILDELEKTIRTTTDQMKTEDEKDNEKSRNLMRRAKELNEEDKENGSN